MAIRSFLSRQLEPYVHGVSMKGLKAGAAVMPFRWPKTFEGEQPSIAMCRFVVE